MTLHPAAWLAWLTSVAVFAFVVTNPLYLLLALGAVVVVHLSFPPDPSPARRAVVTFLVLGGVLLAFRLVFVALLTNPGETILFTLPRVEAPRWLGGFGAGGGVTAEVLAAATVDGLRLIVLLAAFGVFNAHADLAALVRAVPSAFRDAGLVVGIAIAFVPGMMRTVRDVRDARQLRGEKGRRVAPSLAVPVLGLGLERAFLLAESMDSRGYGRGETPRSARVGLWTGLVTLILGVAAWAAGFRTPAAALVVAGGVALGWAFRSAARRSPVTRLAARAVTSFDAFLIAAAAVTCALAVLAGADASYDPYPSVAMPAFQVRTAAISFLIALPAVAGAESR